MIPVSESGVSTTRSSPNSFWSPSVARNTPPSLPTSSPRTTILSFRRVPVRSASFTACRMVITAIGFPPCPLGVVGSSRARFLPLQVRREVVVLHLLERRHLRKDILEHGLPRGGGRVLGSLDRVRHFLLRELVEARVLRLVVPALVPQVVAEPLERVPPPPCVALALP